MEKIARKNSLYTVSMPRENAEFTLKRVITKQQYEILKRGHIPREMEDKWFWYYEDGKLYVHRSWTGYCIYIVTFNMETYLHSVIVNRDNSQYKCTSIEEDKYKLDNLLDWWVEPEYDYYQQWLSEIVGGINNIEQETVFEILGIEDKENPVSNLMAWYMEDREFLNSFLKLRNLKEISEEEFYDIKREYPLEHNKEKMSIDILVRVGNVDRPSRIICIENKINSEEGNMQTKKYYDTLEEIFNDSKERDYIYLTKNNSSVNLSSEHFVHIKYRDVGEVLRDEKFNEYRLAGDFCEYYVDKEERKFFKIDKYDKLYNASDEKFKLLIEYMVWKINTQREFNNIFCKNGSSAKSTEQFYQIYDKKWHFEMSAGGQRKNMNIHLEGYKNGIALHMEIKPYEQFSKIKDRYGEEFFEKYVSVRDELRKKVKVEDSALYQCMPLRENANLSIAKFKINCDTFKEYFEGVMELINEVDILIKNYTDKIL